MSTENKEQDNSNNGNNQVMNTSNPKFWALIGFIIGLLLSAGGEIRTPLDALLGGLIQSAIWFGVSSLIIKRKKNKNGE